MLMYAPGSPPSATVVSLRRRSALHRKRGLGQSLSDLLDVASTALGSGGSVTDVLSSLTGAASDYFAPQSPVTVAPYVPPRTGPSPVLLVGGVAVAGGLFWLIRSRKRSH